MGLTGLPLDRRWSPGSESRAGLSGTEPKRRRGLPVESDVVRDAQECRLDRPTRNLPTSWMLRTSRNGSPETRARSRTAKAPGSAAVPRWVPFTLPEIAVVRQDEHGVEPACRQGAGTACPKLPARERLRGLVPCSSEPGEGVVAGIERQQPRAHLRVLQVRAPLAKEHAAEQHPGEKREDEYPFELPPRRGHHAVNGERRTPNAERPDSRTPVSDFGPSSSYGSSTYFLKSSRLKEFWL